MESISRNIDQLQSPRIPSSTSSVLRIPTSSVLPGHRIVHRRRPMFYEFHYLHRMFYEFHHLQPMFYEFIIFIEWVTISIIDSSNANVPGSRILSSTDVPSSPLPSSSSSSSSVESSPVIETPPSSTYRSNQIPVERCRSPSHKSPTTTDRDDAESGNESEFDERKWCHCNLWRQFLLTVSGPCILVRKGLRQLSNGSREIPDNYDAKCRYTDIKRKIPARLHNGKTFDDLLDLLVKERAHFKRSVNSRSTYYKRNF